MARKQRHPIHLSALERRRLEQIVNAGQGPPRVVARAQMLLWSDAGETDLEIAARLQVTPLTVAQARRRWVQTRQLADRPHPGSPKKLNAAQEAALVALAQSDPPVGRQRWTMQRLADRLLELGIVEAPISDETVRRLLKRRTSGHS